MTRDISNKMTSGELTSIKVGGTAAGKEVALAEDIAGASSNVRYNNLGVVNAAQLEGFQHSALERAVVRTDNKGRVFATPSEDFDDSESTVVGSDATVLTTLTTGYAARTTTLYHPTVTSIIVFTAGVQNTTSADILLTLRINTGAIYQKTFTIPALMIVQIVFPNIPSGSIAIGSNVSVEHKGAALGLTILAAESPTLRISTARPFRKVKSLSLMKDPATITALTTTDIVLSGGTKVIEKDLTSNTITGRVTLPTYAGVYKVSFEATATLGATAGAVEAIISLLLDTGAGNVVKASSIILFDASHLKAQVSLEFILETTGGEVSFGVKSTTSTSSLAFTNGRSMVESLI